MNILNRPMFSRGDVVSTPTLSQEVLKTLEELGINPKNKTTEQLSAELDSYIAQEKRRIVFDPTDPLDYISAGLTATGIGAGAGLGIKALKTGVKGKEAADKIGRLQKIKNLLNPIKINPGKVTPGPLGIVNVGSKTHGLDPLKTATYVGGFGSAAIPDKDETNLNKALGINIEEDTQEQLDKIQNEKSKLTNKETVKIEEKNKIEEQRQAANNEIIRQKMNEKMMSEAYQEKSKQKRQRNTNIFLENMSAAMAGTDNLADGLAIGAANAAKAVGDADQAEALAFETFLEKQKEGKDLSPTDKNKIAADYSEAITHLEHMGYMQEKMNELLPMLDGNVTGALGFLNRIGDSVKGFTGGILFDDSYITDATKSKQLVEYIRTQMVQELLRESGRTISNLDRQLINDIVGDIAGLGSGAGAVRATLDRINDRINASVRQYQNQVSFIDYEYGEQLPNLQIYRKGFGQKAKTTPSNSQDSNSQETEVAVTADDVID